MKFQSENRHHPRLASLNLVDYIHLDESGYPEYEDVGRTIDLSEGGILLECNRIFAIGSLFELQIAVHDTLIKAKGKVAHTEVVPGTDKFDIGLVFVNLSAPDSEQIHRFLAAE